MNFRFVCATPIVIAFLLSGCRQPAPMDAIIVGGSMAPRLVGEHFDVRCADCRYSFRTDIRVPKQGVFACPNCGFGKVEVPKEPVGSQRVTITSGDLPSRWDVIAFRKNGDRDASVKRLIGLPGERIDINGGDVYVNGERVCKSFDDYDRLKIPVFDANHTSKMSLPPRWRSEQNSEQWLHLPGAFHFEPKILSEPLYEPTETDWLEYHHLRGFHHNGFRVEEHPVEDSYAFNQAINRTLVPVFDLSLECQLTSLSDACEFHVRLRHVGGVAEIRIEFGRTQGLLFLSRQQEPVAKFSLPENRRLNVSVASIDSVLRIRVDGRDVFGESIVFGESLRPSSRPFSIGGRTGSFRVENLAIYRDIYYRLLNDSPEGGFVLAADEFFVLGDNVPVSADSRHWKSGTVSKESMLGIVENGGAR